MNIAIYNIGELIGLFSDPTNSPILVVVTTLRMYVCMEGNHWVDERWRWWKMKEKINMMWRKLDLDIRDWLIAGHRNAKLCYFSHVSSQEK